MTLLAESSDVMERFRELCTAVAQGRGLTLTQLACCHALAAELESDEPDVERVAELRRKLGLSAEEVR